MSEPSSDYGLHLHLNIKKIENVIYLSYENNIRISAEIGSSIREYLKKKFKWEILVRDDTLNQNKNKRKKNKDKRLWQEQIDKANIIVCIISKSYDELLIDEFLYINSSNKPVVCIMLDKLAEIKNIGLILVNKKFVKAYKEPENFKKHEGQMFSEFENLIKESMKKNVSKQVKSRKYSIT